MTTKVTNLDDYRPDEVWNCADCGCHVFWSRTDGTMFCAECGELIEDRRTVGVDEADVTAAAAAINASYRSRDEDEDPEP